MFHHRYECPIHLGFGWASTKKDSIVVDVGGGIGSTSMKFAKSFPHLRFVVQDRPAVVAEGIKVCPACIYTIVS